MAINLQNIIMGPCKVIYDFEAVAPDTEVVIEATQGGVVLTYEQTTRDTNIDQLGSTAAKRIITGQPVTAAVPIAEYDLDRLTRMIPGSTLVVNATDPTKKRVDIDASKVIDMLKYARKMKIIPLFEGANASHEVIIHKAAPSANISYTYNYENELITNVNFIAFPDGNRYVSFGDEDA